MNIPTSTRLPALAFALLSIHCGARTPLPGEDGAGVKTGLAGSRIITLDSLTFQGQSRIDGFDDMTGKGFAAYAGDGTFSGSCGPALDGEGRVYFGDAGGSGARIVRVDLASGDVTSFGTPGPGVGQFGGATGVALDSAGRIYAVDVVLHRVVRMDDMSGAGWVAFGGPLPGSGVGQFDRPIGIALSKSGKILVGDENNQRLVQMDDMSGTGFRTWQMPIAAGRQLSAPWGVAVDEQERIYAVDFAGDVLHRLDAIDGSGHAQFLGFPEHQQMSHVTIAEDGRIYMALVNAQMVITAMDDLAGTNLVTYGGPSDHHFMNPCGIAVR